jgi:hypothetical protein
MRRFMLVVVAAIVLPGCTSGERAFYDVPATPLAIDPTEAIELPEWWLSESQLLHLEESGVYRLYNGLSRYAEPRERGRWSKQSYAVLRLEPYAARPVQARRVSLTRLGGQLAVDLGKGDPLREADAPPRVMEDELIGDWRSELALLTLDSGGRFTHRLIVPVSVPIGPALASLGGAWRWTGRVVVLAPDSPAIRPIELAVKTEPSGERTLLSNETGALRRVPHRALESASGEAQQ